MAEAESAVQSRDIRAEILADPDLVLEDREVMQALIEAEGKPGGGRKVVDLRGALVTRLEARLDRLETTHRSVIAAAYEKSRRDDADLAGGSPPAGSAPFR